MKIAHIIHFKTNYDPGIRGFSERKYAERRVVRSGGSLDDLHEVSGEFIYWPPERGPFPDLETLLQWEAEYDSRPVEKSIEERLNQLETQSTRS